MSGIVEIGKEVLEKQESPPPDDPTEEANDAQKEDTSDATECVSDAAAKPDTTPDTTKEELVSDESAKSETSEESISSSASKDSSKKTALEKNGWTMVEKEDLNKDPTESDGNDAGTSFVRDHETDSESIETISDTEEPLIRSFISCSTNNPFMQDGFPSFGSQVSTISSVNSDGIPIRESLESSNYIWSKDGEQAISEQGAAVTDKSADQDNAAEIREDDRREEDSDAEIIAEDIDDVNDEVENAGEIEIIEDRVGDEDGLRLADNNQVSVDDEDDGLRLNFLARLLGDLYPSEELSDDFATVRRGEVYKHNKNFQLNSMLTAAVILVVALAVGLGIGHFLGMSEKLEYVEMYDDIQEEKIDHLQDELVTCISGEEGKGGDDQDLDDRVIKSLWIENQDLRDQIQTLRLSLGDSSDPGDEAMSAVLRDRINSLLTANADLEREVARLRYAEAARGAAESVSTLNQLRKTRDTLNSIVDENSQLKIQVAKSRYSRELNLNIDIQEKINNAVANENPEETVDDVPEETLVEVDGATEAGVEIADEEQIVSEEPVETDSGYNTENEEEIEVETVEPSVDDSTVKTKQESKSTSGEHKRKEYMKKQKYTKEKRDESREETEDNDDDDYEHPVLKEFSRKLSKSLSKIGARVYNAKGNINWEETSKFFTNVQADMVAQLSSLGVLTNEDINLFTEKFSDLRKFVSSEIVGKNYHASRKTSEKLLKSLMNGVKELQDAAEEAAENSAYGSFMKKSFRKIKNGMNNSWKNIKNTFNSIVSKNKYEDNKGKKDWDDSREEDYKNNNFKKHGKDKNSREEDDHKDHKRGEDKKGRDWALKRGKGRENIRKEEQKGEWIFDRSKEREQIRAEERRGDWYWDRKELREPGERDEKYHNNKNAKYSKEKIYS